MSWFGLFRSFVPLQNPIGFGAVDFLEQLLAAMLFGSAAVWRPWVEPYALKLARRTGWCMLLLAVLPVVLRLCLLPNHPVPTPIIYDEFSHLLEADTLRHFRFANPPHPLHQFFETFFVLQEPTYSSIYPPGQGLALALGWILFGHPWAGVVISVAVFCSLCYWMLRAWTSSGWALAGGLLAAMEFGPLNQWMNGYWGGAVPAAAGCLVFGSLPRLRHSARVGDGVLLGLGLGAHLLTRPYETIFLVLSIPFFFATDKPGELRPLAKPILAALLAVVPALALAILQNHQVTQSWTTLPEALSQYQYGVPAALTFQTKPIPHRQLTPEQELGYKMQRSFLAGETDTLTSYFQRLEYRVRFYRFFFYPALYVALLFFLPALRQWRFLWAALTLALFALGVNFFPAFQFHYLAATTCLFVLASVTGLERLSGLKLRGIPVGQEAAWLVMVLCFAHFLFWYGLHLFDNQPFSLALRQYETWDAINHDDPGGRIAIDRQLQQSPGKLLLFVRYWPQHIFQQEWVYNAADIDGARIVWARDLGALENQKLQRYYPDRAVWLLEPDARPPKLSHYEVAPVAVPTGPSPFEQVR